MRNKSQNSTFEISKDFNDIRFSIRSLEKIERSCRVSGKFKKAAMLRKAISQLKMAQRVE